MPSKEATITALESRINDLEIALNQNQPSLAVTFRLTPSLNNVFGLLISLPVVTNEIIQQRLEISADPKVTICRLRKLMEPWDIEIKSRRHIGYWLEQKDKDRIEELVTNLGPTSEEELIDSNLTG